MQRIPAQVTLRSIRQLRGLTCTALAERLEERGVKVDRNHILSVELGHKRGSNSLIVAWADELGINPRDVRQEAELRELLTEAVQDGEAAA